MSVVLDDPEVWAASRIATLGVEGIAARQELVRRSNGEYQIRVAYHDMIESLGPRITDEPDEWATSRVLHLRSRGVVSRVVIRSVAQSHFIAVTYATESVQYLEELHGDRIVVRRRRIASRRIAG